MLKRDFIMVQIEELGKVIARIISQRNSGATRQIPEQIQTVYDALKLDKDSLMNASLDDLCHKLDYEDSEGIRRLEIATKALKEESYLFSGQQRIDRLLRAKDLLEYLQKNDHTFSLERLALLDEINDEINE
ncbi:MAG: hypothetical protein LBN71_05525 [Tannerella sp.]|jgi:nucleotidyltransferase/DNA polymerase involved in DNA repair|nr:hypothetical protein [Tannerella sp.]